MDELVKSFLYKVVGGRDVETLDLNGLVKRCIYHAYRDMLTGGRFVIGKLEQAQLDSIQCIIQKHNYSFKREIIDEVAQVIMSEETKANNKGRIVSRFGLAQKIVNMTFKHFYVFNDFLLKCGIKINYSNCDCPVDSVILASKKLSLRNIVWTRMTKEEYLIVQDKIKENVGPNNIGNLRFDFENW